MVRFIIDYFTTSLPNPTLFTFQYGQIYYMQFIVRYAKLQKNLHSNMVRFIIVQKNGLWIDIRGIYIPIWLDLL